MKSVEIIKKNILATIAIATVLGFSAFKMTSYHPETIESEYWDFIGAENPADNNPEDPNQYQLSSQDPACVTGTEPCQVHAPSNGNTSNPKPDFSQPAPEFSSQTVLQRIQAAPLTNGNETLTMKN